MRFRIMTLFAMLFLSVGLLSLSFQNCAAPFRAISANTPIILNSTADENLNTHQSCSINNNTLLNGDTILTYRQAIVPHGSSCQSETRICENGILSGSYKEAYCEVAPLQNCVVAGKTIASGNSLKVYSMSKPPEGKTCESISSTVRCQDGVLDGNSSVFDKCDENAVNADCQFAGVKILHGESVDAYLSPTVPAGQSCVSSKLICQNGTISGDTSKYSFPNCTPNAPASCLFGTLVVADGDQILGFSTSKVPSGANCNDFSSYRTCTNGVLDQSNYQYSSCSTEAPASCLFNGIQVASGESIVGYKAPQVISPAVCESSSLLCTHGNLVNINQYPAKTCSVVAPSNPYQDLEKLDFNNTIIGDHNQFKLTLTSPENLPVGTIQSIRMEIDGPNATEFKVFPRHISIAIKPPTASPSTPIPNFRIRAQPYTTGLKSARLRIYINDTLSEAYELKANGVTAQLPDGACSADGILISTGSSLRLFGSHEMPMDTPCEYETVRCTNGELSGTYRYADCSTSFSSVSATVPVYATGFYDKSNNYTTNIIDIVMSYSPPLGSKMIIMTKKK